MEIDYSLQSTWPAYSLYKVSYPVVGHDKFPTAPPDYNNPRKPKQPLPDFKNKRKSGS